jgi:ArsR family transcriptional regulator
LPVSDLRRAAEAIRVLGHADRLRILEVIENEPRTVSDVQEALGLEQAVVSQHLARLRQYGIVQAERDGVNVYYEVVEPKVRHILECIRSCDF